MSLDLRKRVLVIEDDEDIALSLKYNLEKDGGYVVETASDGENGLHRAVESPPALIVLDLNLPGLDGLSVCRLLREKPQTAPIPIIMLTARIEESDKIVGLELGADDYITKPFSTKEILARIRAVLRRSERASDAQRSFTIGRLHLDLSRHLLTLDGQPVSLTRKEFDLLTALLENRGRVLSREQLLQKVWGYDYYGETRTVDVHIRRLRKKLGPDFQAQIETVIGVGYRFRDRVPGEIAP